MSDQGVENLPKAPAILHDDGIHVVCLCLSHPCSALVHRHKGFGPRVAHMCVVSEFSTRVGGYDVVEASPDEAALIRALADIDESDKYGGYSHRNLDARRKAIRNRVPESAHGLLDRLPITNGMNTDAFLSKAVETAWGWLDVAA